MDFGGAFFRFLASRSVPWSGGAGWPREFCLCQNCAGDVCAYCVCHGGSQAVHGAWTMRAVACRRHPCPKDKGRCSHHFFWALAVVWTEEEGTAECRALAVRQRKKKRFPALFGSLGGAPNDATQCCASGHEGFKPRSAAAPLSVAFARARVSVGTSSFSIDLPFADRTCPTVPP